MTMSMPFSTAQRRAQERAALHARMEKMKPSVKGKIPRRCRRSSKSTRKPPWDDSVAGKILPPSRCALTSPSAATVRTSSRPNPRIRTIDLTDRSDGSPILSRQVRSITCKQSLSSTTCESQPMTKSAATSPIDTSCTHAFPTAAAAAAAAVVPAVSSQHTEAEALAKLDKHLIELETLEDMLRLHIGDGMSVLGPYQEKSSTTTGSDYEHFESSSYDAFNNCGFNEGADHDEPPSSSKIESSEDDNGKSVQCSIAPLTEAASEIPALLNISLKANTEASLIRSSRASRFLRRWTIEEPFERAGLPAHVVIERAVDVIIDDEIQRLANEMHPSTRPRVLGPSSIA